MLDKLNHKLKVADYRVRIMTLYVIHVSGTLRDYPWYENSYNEAAHKGTEISAYNHLIMVVSHDEEFNHRHKEKYSAELFNQIFNKESIKDEVKAILDEINFPYHMSFFEQCFTQKPYTEMPLYWINTSKYNTTNGEK